jgi:hypothetical protein
MIVNKRKVAMLEIEDVDLLLDGAYLEIPKKISFVGLFAEARAHLLRRGHEKETRKKDSPQA